MLPALELLPLKKIFLCICLTSHVTILPDNCMGDTKACTAQTPVGVCIGVVTCNGVVQGVQLHPQ